MKITLDQETHTYTDTKGDVYKSVSALIDQFVPFFDFEQKSYDYSLKYNIPIEEVRADWRSKNKLSTQFGKKIHAEIEKNLKKKNFVHGEKIYQDALSLVDSFLCKDTKMYSESIVFNQDYKIAGTSDLIIERKNDFDILDFKTNKKIKFDNTFDNSKLLFPVAHLPNAEYFKYALQLSLYGFLYELISGKRLYRLIIFWFKRKNQDDYNNLDGKWVRYSLPYLRDEVIDILNYGAKK